MDIELLALDMDGTLLQSDDTISNTNQRKITEALENNIQVVLSTGRWITTTHSYAQLLNLNSYLITCNGGEIWTTQNELKEQYLLKPERVKWMWELAKGFDVYAWLISTNVAWENNPPENFNDYEWLKFGCDTDDPKILEKIIEELSYIDDIELSNSLPTNIEVNPKGVHKANALKTVCSKLGFTMENVLAIGDSLNDIKMLQEAEIGVAMENAQEAVKDAADYITYTNDADGVAYAIDQWVLKT